MCSLASEVVRLWHAQVACEGPNWQDGQLYSWGFGFFLRCRSVELDLNQAHVEDTPKRKGTKVFGSLERGLDKVITVLTRSKRKGSAKDGPRRLKVSGLEFFNMDF